MSDSDINFFVKLDNNCFLDNSISNDELFIFVLIQKCFNEAKGISMVSINSLLEFMYIKCNNNRVATDIRESVSSLIKKNYITNLCDVHFKEKKLEDINNKDIFIVTIKPLLNKFFTVKESDIDAILNYLQGKNIKKSGLIRYFIAIQRILNYSSELGFGYLAQSKCKIIGESKTLSTYNKILQDDLHLIRYCNDYITPEFRYFTTFFGKCDKDKNKDKKIEIEFNKFIAVEVEARGLIKTDKIVSNLKRSKKKKIKNTQSKIDKINSDTKNIILEEKIKKLEFELEKLQYKEHSKENNLTDDLTDELFS